MSGGEAPRVFSIPPGVPFLPTLAEALLGGTLVPGFRHDGDPLALADATIFVPTRRAARQLRAEFAARAGGTAILPTIRPLGDVDEDLGFFDPTLPEPAELAPPVGALERLLTLAPLVRRWKQNLPGHIARMFEEPVVVPASTAEAIWLSRELAGLMDEMETAETDPGGLTTLVSDELAAWWQVTLEFLQIMTTHWPRHLAEIGRSNPGAHRSRLIDAEAERLARNPPAGPVVAAGSTGSIPATARLLAAIARVPQGAVVLPGVDRHLDRAAWEKLGEAQGAPSICGHPQYGLKRLLDRLGCAREDVVEIGATGDELAARARILSEALRPAETTDAWSANRDVVDDALAEGALDRVTLVEAPNERDEAVAIALALRLAAAKPDARAALVTADRALARRVSAELLRFGIVADDSGGTPLEATPPAVMLRLLVEAMLRPGDPVAVLSLLKQPLLCAGWQRPAVRSAVDLIELAALRGGTGRPDLGTLAADFEARLKRAAELKYKPVWLSRHGGRIDEARAFLKVLEQALAPLAELRASPATDVPSAARATVLAFEALGRTADGGLGELYRGEAGERLAETLRALMAASPTLDFAPSEWPDVLAALIAGESVKPRVGADKRIAIWGALEARLQSADTLVCGGLNEGVWPSRADPGAFLSRVMKVGIDLDPPERRIGQAAHDFAMAAGAPELILTRAARSGDAPSVPSRWLQRLTACAGAEAARAMRARGTALLEAARHHAGDRPDKVAFAPRPKPKPPLEARPPRFSVTEIEALRRDPYAVYARKVLKLEPLEPLLREPGAAERGSLFHDILHGFTLEGGDVADEGALGRLLTIARRRFDEEALPADVDAVWWPRFVLMAPHLIGWERQYRAGAVRKLAEVEAAATPIDGTGVALSGRADRIDLHPGGLADILDYKTGSSPTRADAHQLVAPQLSLEAALLSRGAFGEAGRQEPGDLVYVRLRARGDVENDSILTFKNKPRKATEMAEDAWERLRKLILYYSNPDNGYLSRAMPYKENDADGDYDHLARVLEWSAGGESDEDEPVAE